ncbi:hypothetical protein GCM10022226_63560 [Sphaerisporangium flaviroseum]|uniref:Uncharacterized protein n=1 Tax=Sphaerisporangium flaviroseum TaxID=509199 RepID=A0ABP7J3Z3_9ACTN
MRLVRAQGAARAGTRRQRADLDGWVGEKQAQQLAAGVSAGSSYSRSHRSPSHDHSLDLITSIEKKYAWQSIFMQADMVVRVARLPLCYTYLPVGIVICQQRHQLTPGSHRA